MADAEPVIEELYEGGVIVTCAVCGDDWVDDGPGSMTMKAVPIWSCIDYLEGALKAYAEHAKEKHADQDHRSNE